MQECLLRKGCLANGQQILPDAPNMPPDVYAGPDQIVVLNQATQLRGQAADDGKPENELLFNWTVLRGEVQAVKFEIEGYGRLFIFQIHQKCIWDCFSHILV